MKRVKKSMFTPPDDKLFFFPFFPFSFFLFSFFPLSFFLFPFFFCLFSFFSLSVCTHSPLLSRLLLYALTDDGSKYNRIWYIKKFFSIFFFFLPLILVFRSFRLLPQGDICIFIYFTFSHFQVLFSQLPKFTSFSS